MFLYKKRMFTKIQTQKDTTNNKEEDRHNLVIMARRNDKYPEYTVELYQITYNFLHNSTG
jgi:hypothetical protein